MSSHPRLSIVIPHLNEPDSLQRCLAALNAQRNPNIPFEIIVVDNGSRIPPARRLRGGSGG
ncbi:glycosyltransferase family 2 protein [Mesorhizobium terrae]